MTHSAAAAQYEKECQQGLAKAKSQLKALEEIKGPKTVATVLEPLNDLWITLDYGLNKADLFSRVHPDPDVRHIADTCEQEFSKIQTNLGLSRPVYDAVAAVDVSHAKADTMRFVAHTLRDFRRAGVDKDEATREKIRKLQEELVQIGQEFSKNIRDDVRTLKLKSAADLDGLPQDFIAGHEKQQDGTIHITTDYPDYFPFMSYAKNDADRRALYVLFHQRGYPKNQQVLQQMLDKRYELARLLGFKNWAEYITADKMIKTAEHAEKFIDKIDEVATPRAKHDYAILLKRLQEIDPKATSVGDWQKTYLQQLIKREKYHFDSQKVRQYFAYDKVRDGVLHTVSTMFKVTFKKVDLPVWDPSVEAYEVDDHGKAIGRFYLDMHPRQGKYKHAAAFPIRTGVEGKQLPEAALVCNFPGGPNGDGSPYMEHSQVETFFHEFGHLMHHILGGDQRWLTLSGMNVEWDFVEAPSQMLEEWGWDPATLETFATNKDGQPIPDALVQAMRKARDFGKGVWVKHQMFYAALSLDYYDSNPEGLDTTAMLEKLQAEYSPFAYVGGTHFQDSFGHLEGYSAMYYTYMWSLVIAKDMFSRFQKQGLLNPEVAARYRKDVLAPGGSKDAAVLVHDFLGRDYSFDSFAHWLGEE